MNRIYSFLRELSQNNNREWFSLNKSRYLEVKQLVDELTSKFIAEVAVVDPDAAMLSPADCTYRIYRDTRFSTDKTPYKTHIGIFVNPPFGKKGLTCGYYLHLEPENTFFAAGTIGHPSNILKAIRQSIFDEIDEYRTIVDDPQFRSLLPGVGDSPLKTAPKGFPKDWEFIDYLKPRNFVASGPITENSIVEATDLCELLRPYIRQAFRFNQFMNFTIEDYI